MGENVWHQSVPDAIEFARFVEERKRSISLDSQLRSQALELYKSSSSHSFGYFSSWMGVPIIRLAEDLIREQEIIFSEKPSLVIEVGIARGGGMVFAASMQELAGMTPRVIGIDNKIFPHTMSALSMSKYGSIFDYLEADSTSSSALDFLRAHILPDDKVLLILDSDHSSSHVYEELSLMTPLLSSGSLILVCDTVIDELPPGHYQDRTWADGRGPLDAINRFKSDTDAVEQLDGMTSDLLLSEIRGGLLRVV